VDNEVVSPAGASGIAGTNMGSLVMGKLPDTDEVQVGEIIGIWLGIRLVAKGLLVVSEVGYAVEESVTLASVGNFFGTADVRDGVGWAKPRVGRKVWDSVGSKFKSYFGTVVGNSVEDVMGVRAASRAI
jgi:hypothetical protein